jgi:hypothetical protein
MTNDRLLTSRCHQNLAANVGSGLRKPPMVDVEHDDLTGCVGGGLRQRQGGKTGVGRLGFGYLLCRPSGVTWEGAEIALIKPAIIKTSFSQSKFPAGTFYR